MKISEMIHTLNPKVIKVLLRIPERAFTRYSTMKAPCISGDKSLVLPIFPATTGGFLQLSSEFQDDSIDGDLSIALTHISLNTHVITRF